MVLERGASPELVFKQHHERSSASFWRRFGGMPDVRGKRVFDFGCGTGGMVHRLMKGGAASAVGLDLSERAIDYAKVRLAQEWGDAVDIRRGDVRTEQFAPVDLIVSQNTLEHVMPLHEVVLSVIEKAKPGADIFFGFSPLWYSPFGNHHYPPGRLPWRHLIQGDKVVLDAFRRIAKADYASIEDAGFNRCVPQDYFRLFRELPVEIVSLRTNIGDSPAKSAVLAAFGTLGSIAGLGKYTTVGIYAHLRRKG